MGLTDVFSYYSSLFPDGTPAVPWRLDSWLWVTQGHVLIAWDDDGSEADPTPESKITARKYLAREPDGLVEVSLSALQVFAGAVVPAYVACEECEGSGTGDLFRCEGQLGLRKPNEANLAFALAQVPPAVIVSIGTLPSVSSTAKGYSALAVVGAGWRVVLMGVREDAMPSDAPIFPAPSVEEPVSVGAVDPADGVVEA